MPSRKKKNICGRGHLVGPAHKKPCTNCIHMSFNHLAYDHCTYKRNLKENVSMLSYILSPFRYEHAQKCRHELGLVGGTAVSHIKGNIVDLESDLRGQTRYATRCAAAQHHPLLPGETIHNDKTPPIHTDMLHLPRCQMVSYRSVPLPSNPRQTPCQKK